MKNIFPYICLLLLVIACGSPDQSVDFQGEPDVFTIDIPSPSDILDSTTSDDKTPSDLSEIPYPEDTIEEITEEPCPAGLICVNQLPAYFYGNTAEEPPGIFDSYPCKPSADESGPEVIYRLQIEEEGFFSAAVYEDEGVDVDLHLLSELDPQTCLTRGNRDISWDIQPGIYYLVVDTYVSSGIAKAGPYRLEIGFLVPSRGPCTMESGTMPRVDDNGNHLSMPATGPVVKEAHLVTQEEPPPYPGESRQNIETHYTISQEKSGLIMYRQEPWAPTRNPEEFGVAIYPPQEFPVEDEAWYVCMYWTPSARPSRGTRMILRLPGTNRAVVVSAGYEAGPGNLANIGGTVEETHFYLGTVHKSELTLGIATDQSLPLGPRICE